MFRFGLFFKFFLLLYVPWASSCFMLHLSQLTKMTAVPCGAVLQPQSFEVGDGSHGCPLVCSTADHVSTCTEGKEGKHPQTSKMHTIKSIVCQSFKTSKHPPPTHDVPSYSHFLQRASDQRMCFISSLRPSAICVYGRVYTNVHAQDSSEN